MGFFNWKKDQLFPTTKVIDKTAAPVISERYSDPTDTGRVLAEFTRDMPTIKTAAFAETSNGVQHKAFYAEKSFGNFPPMYQTNSSFQRSNSAPKFCDTLERKASSNNMESKQPKNSIHIHLNSPLPNADQSNNCSCSQNNQAANKSTNTQQWQEYTYPCFDPNCTGYSCTSSTNVHVTSSQQQTQAQTSTTTQQQQQQQTTQYYVQQPAQTVTTTTHEQQSTTTPIQVSVSNGQMMTPSTTAPTIVSSPQQTLIQTTEHTVIPQTVIQTPAQPKTTILQSQTSFVHPIVEHTVDPFQNTLVQATVQAAAPPTTTTYVQQPQAPTTTTYIQQPQAPTTTTYVQQSPGPATTTYVQQPQAPTTTTYVQQSAAPTTTTYVQQQPAYIPQQTQQQNYLQTVQIVPQTVQTTQEYTQYRYPNYVQQEAAPQYYQPAMQQHSVQQQYQAAPPRSYVQTKGGYQYQYKPLSTPMGSSCYVTGTGGIYSNGQPYLVTRVRCPQKEVPIIAPKRR